MRINTTTRLGRRLEARGEFVIGTNRRRLTRAGVRFRPRLVDAPGTDRAVRRRQHASTPPSWSGPPATGPTTPGSHIPGVIADGRAVHRRGVTDVPGLYFLGLPWQYTRGSALLGFVADDAAYLAEQIATRAGADRSTRVGPAAPLTRPA